MNQIFKAVWLSRKNMCCGAESALQVAPWIGLGARPLLSKLHQVPAGQLRKGGPFSGSLLCKNGTRTVPDPQGCCEHGMNTLWHMSMIIFYYLRGYFEDLLR